MRAYQLIAGFSDIKSELRSKYWPSKSMSEIDLCFVFENDVLYATNRRDSSKLLAVVIWEKNSTPLIRLRKETIGLALINHFLSFYQKQEIAKMLNDSLESHGFRTSRGR